MVSVPGKGSVRKATIGRANQETLDTIEQAEQLKREAIEARKKAQQAIALANKKRKDAQKTRRQATRQALVESARARKDAAKTAIRQGARSAYQTGQAAASGLQEGFHPVSQAREGWREGSEGHKQLARDRVQIFIEGSTDIARHPSLSSQGGTLFQGLRNAVGNFRAQRDLIRQDYSDATAKADEAHAKQNEAKLAEFNDVPSKVQKASIQAAQRMYQSEGGQNDAIAAALVVAATAQNQRVVKQATKVLQSQIKTDIKALETERQQRHQMARDVRKDDLIETWHALGTDLKTVAIGTKDAALGSARNVKASFIHKVERTKEGLTAIREAGAHYARGVWVGIRRAATGAIDGAIRNPIRAAKANVRGLNPTLQT